MSGRGNNGKAVQILQINDDDSFSLNESQLEAILLDDRVKDKHVAVVSVAGPNRQGKSFLLAFLLRFLLHQGKKNWLDDPSIPLGGFEWSPGSTRHTTGILLWNAPFLVTTPEGEEVAVLLMDTQGSFDCKSTVKECTTIFALSIMISSVQVYNIFRNIQIDHLHQLQFLSEYGYLAQQETRGEPFQRLVFLVRDWAFHYEADFGAVGDRCILQQYLHIMDEEHDGLQPLRSQIWSCFSQIDCFLMPPPGDKVETGCSFDGCLRDIDGKFKQKLRELAPWLLAPENLVVKQINGHQVTCEELMNYFRAYARVFQGGTLPPPKSVLQATAETSNMAAKEKATKFYVETIDTVPRGDCDKLLEAHTELLDKAVQLFRSTPKVGDGSDSQRYTETLRTDLQVRFNRLYKLALREKENDEQRKRETEIDREKEDDRQREREMHKDREEEWAAERDVLNEREWENQKKIEEMELIVPEPTRKLDYKSLLLCVVFVMLSVVAFVCNLYVVIIKRSNRSNTTNV